MATDRYAHLRESLALYRAMHAVRSAETWCRSCEAHLADESGLCPVCRPERTSTESGTGAWAEAAA